MIDVLSVASDGYLSKTDKTLAIATNGYISVFAIVVIPVEKKKKSKKGGRRRREEEEILIYIEIFMILWTSKRL